MSEPTGGRRLGKLKGRKQHYVHKSEESYLSDLQGEEKRLWGKRRNDLKRHSGGKKATHPKPPPPQKTPQPNQNQKKTKRKGIKGGG